MSTGLQRHRPPVSLRKSPDLTSTWRLTGLCWSPLRESWPGLFLGPHINFLLLLQQITTNLPASQVELVVESPPASTGDSGDAGSTPRWGTSPGGGMATHSSILAWRTPWTEAPGWLQSMGSHRVGLKWLRMQVGLNQCKHTILHFWRSDILKQRSRQGYILSGSSRRVRFLVFSSFQKLSAFHGSWPHHSDLRFQHDILLIWLRHACLPSLSL